MMSFTYRMSRSVRVNSRRCVLLLVFATVSSACVEGRHGTAPEPSNRRTVLPDREGDSHPITIYPGYVQRLGTAYRSPDIRTVTAAVEDAFLSVEVNFAPGTFARRYRTVSDRTRVIDSSSWIQASRAVAESLGAPRC